MLLVIRPCCARLRLPSKNIAWFYTRVFLPPKECCLCHSWMPLSKRLAANLVFPATLLLSRSCSGCFSARKFLVLIMPWVPLPKSEVWNYAWKSFAWQILFLASSSIMHPPNVGGCAPLRSWTPINHKQNLRGNMIYRGRASCTPTAPHIRKMEWAGGELRERCLVQ